MVCTPLIHIKFLTKFLANLSSNIQSRDPSINTIMNLCSFSNKTYASSNSSSASSSSSSDDQRHLYSSIILSLWHNRLGHPALSVVETIMNSCNNPNSNKIDPVFCPACCMGKIHKFHFSLQKIIIPLLFILFTLMRPFS